MKDDEKPGRRPGHAEASAVVIAALGTARFPATKESLVQEVGTWRVPVGDGRVASLAEVLNVLPEHEFRSFSDASNKVDAHWDKVWQALQARKK